MALPGFRNHPKFRRLVAALGIPEAHVLGHVEMMWEVCYESGNPVLGDDVDVELAAGWGGEPGALCTALVACGGKTRAGLIEETSPGSGVYQVHDLEDHAPSYVESRRIRQEERGKDKTCGHCGTVFRSPDTRAKFCSDACRKADWRVRHQNVPGTQGDGSGTDGDESGTQGDRSGRRATEGDAPETDGDGTTRPDQPSPGQPRPGTSTPFGGVGGLNAESEQPPKPTKAPKVPSWGKAHEHDVVETAQEIMAFWPDHQVDYQPTRPGEPRQKVPHSKAPLLATALSGIKRSRGDLKICVAIAQRAVDEWKAGAWTKAAQHFFGPKGPWEAYYQAHITNQASEDHPASPPRPRSRTNGELRPLAEVAP